MIDRNKKILEIISSAENINRLPLYEDLRKELNDEDFDFLHDEDFEEIEGTEITIKDGTKVILERNNDNTCFSNKEHCDFYYIKENDTYICLDCGLRQKLYEYESDELCNSVLLPADWNKKGMEAYLKRRIEREEERNEKIRLRYEERLKLKSYANCSNCIHMQYGECEYGNDEDFIIEMCHDWEHI